MIRRDFVSNSSSSSYVVCVGKDYELKDFIYDVCSKCADETNQYHMKDLVDRNIATLMYHTFNTRLLFLGEAYVCDREFDVDRTKCPEWEEKNYWEEEFDRLYNDIKKKGKDNKLSQWDNDYEIASDTLIKGIDHIWMSCITSSKPFDMDFTVWKGENKEFNDKSNQQTVEHIKDVLNMRNENQSKYWMEDAYYSDTYVIDQSTIDRTRLMIQYGMKLRFEKWENLDKIQKMLDDGKKIIHIRVANSGDGIEADYIYNETGNYVFKGIPVQFLTSEVE